MIESLLDMAAQTAMNTFRLSAEYFYEDRKSGERLPIQCIERTVKYHEDDPASDGLTIVYSGKVFLLTHADWETLDSWRKKNDVRQEPTPFDGDYIVRIVGGQTERYEITYREPYSVVGADRALYRINTIFVSKDG